MSPYRRWCMSLKQPFDTVVLDGKAGGYIGPKSAMGWCTRVGGGAGADLSLKGTVTEIVLAEPSPLGLMQPSRLSHKKGLIQPNVVTMGLQSNGLTQH